MDYGRAVRIIRATRGMTQTELAEKIGRRASYISLIESGKRTPSLTTAARLCDALRVPKALLNLLAAGPEQLRNIDQVTAGFLGAELLNLLIEAEDEHDDIEQEEDGQGN